ncbi:S8 family serine peptidase [Microbulbifer pacificus]|uniref:S8 family serine peptidase n=1 Tax=Microbulbifer pacificus TaxID=407164 RepID=A0AAU0MXK0_9GAMM|nr:S8 family serine peptidase [Microbulbifer pacificus]WOX05405.1 S8 family serine peptidase [Microbulbifer pacificus]
MHNSNKTRFSKCLIASLTALYVAGGVAAIDSGTTNRTGLHASKLTLDMIRGQQDQGEFDIQGSIYEKRQASVNQVRKKNAGTVFEPQANASGEISYIVQLSDEPVANFSGAVDQLQRSVNNSKGLNTSRTVEQYRGKLLGAQSNLMNAAKAHGIHFQVQNQYTMATNAMAVRMTQDQAMRLAEMPGVKRITPSRVFELNSDRSVEFLGADKVHDGSVTAGVPYKGEGMVLGIIDTGINTDHVAFAAVGGDGYEHTNPLGEGVYVGDCTVEASLCNDKLIGVHSYPVITDVYKYWQPSANRRPIDGKSGSAPSGEDYHGHGSHTASTAGGNIVFDTPLQVPENITTSDGVNQPFNFPKTSGIAPHANIIAYQVCYAGNAGDEYAGCPEEAILAAIDDAITDGVDVINFSIGGAESFPWEDPMELAFLSAREAGISVAVAAGNSGAYWTTDHTSPWLTSVGALTHDRVLKQAEKTIGNFSGGTAQEYRVKGKTFNGVSYSDAINGRVVYAGHYENPNSSLDSKLCEQPFPAGTFDFVDDLATTDVDESTLPVIVLCDRGENARVAKAQNVAAGGAEGFILGNVSSSETLVADPYVIPGIHINSTDRNNLYYWLNANQSAVNMAEITAGVTTYSVDPEAGNIMAYFSSAGPSVTNTNHLVPAIAAPGVSVYAANADDQPFTINPFPSDWTFMSGTSMASPQVAGAMTLVKQAHPDWTPAEIQSALMLTAGEAWGADSLGRKAPLTNFFRQGAGSLNIAAAAQAGLVMNETIENYLAANPSEGGRVEWLNTASMVYKNCQKSCSWVRTLRATKDGTWTATSESKYDSDAKVTVTPEQFSLRAGEEQAIMVTVEVADMFDASSQNPFEDLASADTDGRWFFGDVVLTETSGASPRNHLPVVAGFDRGVMPDQIALEIHREQGREVVGGLPLPESGSFEVRKYGLTKANVQEFDLGRGYPFIVPGNMGTDRGWGWMQIDVPAGTKQLVVEALSYAPVDPENLERKASVMVGIDRNGSGTDFADATEYNDELVCTSFHPGVNNFCVINNPEPGSYWAVIHNSSFGGHGLAAHEAAKVTGGYAVISADTDADNMTITLPESSNGGSLADIVLDWNLPESVKGDVYYGAFDLGVTGAPGSIGLSAVRVERGKDEVNLDISQKTAKPGDVLDFTLDVRHNLESSDRSYDIKTTLPEGLTLVEGSLNSTPTVENLATETGVISLNGIQPSTRDVARDYIVTTNATDPMCHTPIIDEYSDGKYIDLLEFNIRPLVGLWEGGADYRSPVQVSTEWLFWMDDAEIPLFGLPHKGFVEIFPNGILHMDENWWSWRLHRPAGYGFAHSAVMPYWRGSFQADYFNSPDDVRGLTIANQYAAERPDLGDLVFMEYDNIVDPATGTAVDFEVIMRNGIDYREGFHEIIMAYDNLSGDLTEGSIGVEQADGFLTSNGPLNGFRGENVGYDNLDQMLKNDLVICYDYRGPEQSAMQVKFKARVNESAAGKTLEVNLDNAMEFADTKSSTQQIVIKGNIKLSGIADQEVDEDGTLEGIQVLYVDADKVGNTIEVSGEHITATVNGHTSGSTFDITPEANFSGETEVTVTVRDNNVTSDASSVTFKLMVNAVDDAPVAAVAGDVTIKEGESATLDAGNSSDADGDVLTFSWSGPGTINGADTAKPTISGLSAGKHEFTVSVSDGANSSEATVTVTVEGKQKKKGGSVYYLLALLAAAGLFRRRKLA